MKNLLCHLLKKRKEPVNWVEQWIELQELSLKIV